MADTFKIALTGVAEIDRKLKSIASENGSKSINKQMRKETRKAAKEIVLPEVRQEIPVETGYLESLLTVRALRRSRGKLGHQVGFRDPLFQGESFYGGFLEFGWELRGGGFVPGDSFLRRPLYRNEGRVFGSIRSGMTSYVGSL